MMYLGSLKNHLDLFRSYYFVDKDACTE